MQSAYSLLVTKNYSKIKAAVYRRSFKFNLNGSDLLSLVNERLAINIRNDKFNVQVHEKMFWSYMHSIIYSCAMDLKRESSRHNFVEIDNIEVAGNADINDRLTAKLINEKIFSLIKRETHRKIFTEIIINGCKYEDTAALLNINLSTVKTVIFQIRKKAIENYKHLYY